MEYILSGSDAEVSKIIRENQIRVQRGWVTFTPCARVDTDDKYVVMSADRKELPGEPKRPKTAKPKAAK